MSRVACNACVSPADCAEADQCLNQWVTMQLGGVYLGPTNGPARPAAAPPSAPQAQPEPRVATGPANRPAAGTLTGRVWDIADALEPVTHPSNLRSAVVAHCESVGINKSTASVQFGKWRSSK